MLHEERTDVSDATPESLAEAYHETLRAIVAERGPAATSEATGVDLGTVESIADGEAIELDLADAAAIQALDSELDAETIHAEATDHLLLGMSMAVLDVDTIAAEYEGDLSGKGIQQRLERRAPMTLTEFARIEHFVADRR